MHLIEILIFRVAKHLEFLILIAAQRNIGMVMLLQNVVQVLGKVTDMASTPKRRSRNWVKVLQALSIGCMTESWGDGGMWTFEYHLDGFLTNEDE
jgi:hypothetical protein